ncbi:hypothetical protein GCM10028820_13310 [Tessaracoccus terricola]
MTNPSTPGPQFQPSSNTHWNPTFATTANQPGYAATPTQPTMPTVPRELGTPSAPPPRGEASYGTAQAFSTKPRKRSAIAGVLAAALLVVGGSGAVGAATALSLAGPDGGTTVAAGSTQVVQADPSNPDWAATAAAVEDAVVAIEVTGMSGSGQGSGVILDSAGNIVTNNHVIAGGGAQTQITVVIGTRAYEAEVVGTDPSTDLAVIRLLDPPSDLQTIGFADISDLAVGDPVMAVGNPLGLADTVTTGIVSALDRPVSTRAVSNNVSNYGDGVVVTPAIQTNAAINPGNSGGALVNSAGELVGITSSIATLTSGNSESGNIGIGFAIPVTQVKYVVDQLLTTGVAQHAQLGISASDVEGSSQLGAQVAEVVSGSPADKAGLRTGDVINALDGRPITSSESLVALIRASEVGQTVTLNVIRNGSEEQVEATLTAAAG